MIYGSERQRQRIRDWATQQSAPQQAQAQADPNGQPWTARDNGITWNPGAAQTVQGRTSIDPNTGALVGPDSLIPHQLGLQYQAEHDRRVWDYRQRLMRDANSYGQGALGLMQSFRPGGGATLEAGQYNNLAQIQLNRAQLTTPMDLLGDYRRHTQAVAQQKANRAAERQMAVQVGVAIAGLGAAAITGGATLPAAIGAIGNVAAASMTPGGQANVDANQGPQAIPGQGQPMPGILQPGGDQSAPGQAPGQAGGMAPGQAPAVGTQGTSGQQAVQPGTQPGRKRVAGPPGGGGPGGPGGQGGPQAAGAGGGGLNFGGGGGPGADGVFTPTAYATFGASQQNPVQRAILSSQLAQQLDDDPFYDSFSFAVNARFAQRMAQA